MTTIYYYWVLGCAITAFVTGVAAYWRNRSQAVGPLLGGTMVLSGFWLIGFAQYFNTGLKEEAEIGWAQFTLGSTILNMPLFFHCLCALVGHARRWRWWILAAYASGVTLLVLLMKGLLISGVRQCPFIDRKSTRLNSSH